MEMSQKVSGFFAAHVAVCDDQRTLGGRIEQILLDMRFSGLEVEVYESGEALLRDWDRGTMFQILFLDIEMPGMNGLTLAKEIRRRDRSALILFVSSHQEYVFDTFSVEPFRFVRKPVQEEEIRADMYAAVEKMSEERRYYGFQISKTHYQIAYDEIRYFEGSGRKIRLYTDQEAYEYYGKISEVMEELDPCMFCQIHSSYIVNLNRIRAISGQQVLLADGTELPVSKARKDALHQSHMNFMFRKAGVN